jgi:hypothetical protein|tara:strand:- start:24935 stop:25594 length:660 start_codon:yes stop_codon:yes gene_type:complete
MYLKNLINKSSLKSIFILTESMNLVCINSKTFHGVNCTKQKQYIKNKGTDAGGSNTTKNGRSYEELVELDDRITIIKKYKFSNIINFDNSSKTFMKPYKKNLFKCMEKEIDSKVNKGHGCKKPDECYIDEQSKKIFIIEKKFQQCAGSCAEKIQTCDFKTWQYTRTFQGNYKIIYIYCLSDWFKTNCLSELEYLDIKNVPYFWGSSETYKDDIINFILN